MLMLKESTHCIVLLGCLVFGMGLEGGGVEGSQELTRSETK